ncbi:MAG: hypothetical protein JXR96_20505 [Deltaproteobacteria bacterium]|nr:hypothetical protein [Deltaproteobacteria bacterium]
MNDTPAEVESRFNFLLRRISPEERLAMSCRMFTAARALVRSSIVQGGARTAAEIRRQTFLRFYRDDFSDDEQAKILSSLKAT